MTDTLLVYVTASDRDEALDIAERAVRARAAACANVLGQIEAVFWWDGEVQTGSEVALILKTTSERLADLTSLITSAHSYDCPCIVAMPIVGGNDAFVSWIGMETGDKAESGEEGT